MITFYDTETTGFAKQNAPDSDPTQPEFVQLAAISTDDEGEILHQINLMVKADSRVPESAYKIHGISSEKSDKYGVDRRAALAIFQQMVLKSNFVVAHNEKFDRKVVRSVSARSGSSWKFMKPWICTMKDSKEILKVPPTARQIAVGRTGYKEPNLTEAHKALFGEGFDGAHDALADVKACMRVFFELRKNPEFNIQELLVGRS